MAEQLLRVEGISKSYGGVQALNKVQFDLNYGEVHALVGENGAGKSTLIKILGGIVPRDEGRIFFNGKEVNFNHASDAQNAGIAIIHQELSVLPSLNVIENLFMGRMKNRFGLLNWKQLEKQTREALALVELDVDPYATARDLSISQRQLIEIACALSTDARLIIMDEPNSSLSDSETERLFHLIHNLQSQDIAIMYVSHKIDEVLEISDRITAFRDGTYVGTIESESASEDSIISMMVGRELNRDEMSTPGSYDTKLLEVSNLTGNGFKDVSFDLYKGEILAFSGLVGAGRSEVLRAIFGADPYQQGNIILNGKNVRFNTPAHAIKHGIAMVPEDRKVLSLFMEMQIAHNISMAQLPVMSRLGIILDSQENSLADKFVEQLDVRLASVHNPVSSLSGGNQQKTVLARWLATNPQLLILDEPTHGVDVGAKAEIYDLIRTLADEGMGIVLISSELPEVMALAHRILVMCQGRVTGIVARPEATEELIMAYATGVKDDFGVLA